MVTPAQWNAIQQSNYQMNLTAIMLKGRSQTPMNTQFDSHGMKSKDR